MGYGAANTWAYRFQYSTYTWAFVCINITPIHDLIMSCTLALKILKRTTAHMKTVQYSSCFVGTLQALLQGKRHKTCLLPRV